MAKEVSREKNAGTSEGRWPPELGRVLLESARQEESNGVGLEVSVFL